MKFWSDEVKENDFIPARYAAGAIGVDGFSSNLNPSFRWDNVPEQTQSFVLICHDPDAPSVKDDVNKTDREVSPSTPRATFFHWLLVDLPAHVHSIQAGEYSNGFTMKGKQAPIAAHGSRQGLNDYTVWSKEDPEMAGLYYGYDGPFPPFNDSIPHRYIFTLYALSADKLNVQGDFNTVKMS